MTEPPARPASTDATADRDGTAGPPRWVKVVAIVAVVLIAAMVIVMLVSGGSHGPGRHG